MPLDVQVSLDGSIRFEPWGPERVGVLGRGSGGLERHRGAIVSLVLRSRRLYEPVFHMLFDVLRRRLPVLACLSLAAIRGKVRGPYKVLENMVKR